MDAVDFWAFVECLFFALDALYYLFTLRTFDIYVQFESLRETVYEIFYILYGGTFYITIHYIRAYLIDSVNQ